MTFYRRFGKRAFDLAGATLALLVLSPLLVAAAAAIKLTSKGPVFYTQRRVGRGGRPFDVIKFRTMVVGAERMGTGVLVTKNDARVTTAGRILRTWSIDELPQLFNVLSGSMSAIGPRPGLPFQADQYTPDQRRRLDVRPGISGWAQVNGRNSIPWDQRIRLDLEYIDRMSFWLDCEIVFRTLRIMLVREQQFADGEFFKAPAPDAPAASPESMQAGSKV